VPRHQIAFDHFAPSSDGFGEALKIFFLLTQEFDGDEDADGKSDGALIERCAITRDHAALFQHLDAPVARRGRESDLCRNLLHRHPAVLLKQGQDFAVNVVDVDHLINIAA